MGQLFCACAYDPESRDCCAIEADKFHANCYSYSGAVFSMHYLLCQKPYHIMWVGDNVLGEETFECFTRTEELLGISTFLDFELFALNIEDIQKKSCYDKVMFVEKNNKLWKRMKVWDKAIAYFDGEHTRSVRYQGYLVNHTQKSAVDLEDYFVQSKYIIDDIEAAIDPVPVLTETGWGAIMALKEGVASHSTEELAGKWCGDLLQIVDELPDGYEIKNCCFSNMLARSEYCYRTFGVDQEGYLLGDGDGALFEYARLNSTEERRPMYHIRIEKDPKYIKLVPVRVEEI